VPLRQIEAAELMVAMNKYTIGYAKSLVAATSPAHLAEDYKPKTITGSIKRPGCADGAGVGQS
jgi:hypothetical protein